MHAVLSTPHLPIEIFELVIDTLGRDVIVLKSLSLVCHALVYRCRRYLFSSIHLRPNRITGFAELLHNNSSIVVLIKHLYLYICDSAKSNADFHQALLRLKHLTMLRLIAELWEESFESSDMSSLLSVIIRLIHGPHMRKLTLGRNLSQFPISVIRGSQITKLVSGSASFTVNIPPTIRHLIDHASPSADVRVFELKGESNDEFSDNDGDSPEALATLLQPSKDGEPAVLDAEKLDEVVARVEDIDSLSALKPFATAPNLARVSWNIDTTETDIDGLGSLTLPFLSKIRHLHIVVFIKTNEVEPLINTLCEELGYFKSKNHLKTLKLYFSLFLANRWEILPGEADKRLGQLFLEDGWPSLEYVSWTVSLHELPHEKTLPIQEAYSRLPETFLNEIATSKKFYFSYRCKTTPQTR